MPAQAAPGQAFGGGQIACTLHHNEFGRAHLSAIDTTVRTFRLKRPRLYLLDALLDKALVDRRSVPGCFIRIVNVSYKLSST